MKCPVCDGKVWGTNLGDGMFIPEDCTYCDNTLEVSLYKWLSYHFWVNAPEWIWEVRIWIADRIYGESEDE